MKIIKTKKNNKYNVTNAFACLWDLTISKANILFTKTVNY